MTDLEKAQMILEWIIKKAEESLNAGEEIGKIFAEGSSSYVLITALMYLGDMARMDLATDLELREKSYSLLSELIAERFNYE